MPRSSQTAATILSLFDAHHLLSAKEIMTLIPQVNKTTIYRNIYSLISTGHLKELVHDKNNAVYERTSDPHHHFICDRCSTVFPISLSIEVLSSFIQSNLYSVQDAHMDIHGLCNNCRTITQMKDSGV